MRYGHLVLVAVLVTLSATVFIPLSSTIVSAAPYACGVPNPVSGCTASGTTTCGVKICGICYDCSVTSDSVCPSNYAPGKSCGVCDPDCWSACPVGSIFDTTAQANPSMCGCKETNCFDALDNNGNAETDYDTIQGGAHGDVACPVAINVASANPAAVIEGNTVIVDCTIAPSVTFNPVIGLNSIFAYLDNDNSSTWTAGDVNCGWPVGSTFIGNVARFNGCSVGTVSVANEVKRFACGVYSSASEPFNRAYQTGGDAWTAVTVTDSSCGSQGNQVACTGVPGCMWCGGAVCGAAPSVFNASAGTCIANTGVCTSACTLGQCGAQCDSSGFGAATCSSVTGGATTGTLQPAACNLATCSINSASCYENNTVAFPGTPCDDNIDNDLSGEIDYDGTPVFKGDMDCKVSLSAISAPATAVVGLPYNVDCTTPQNTAGGLTSLFAYVDNNNNNINDTGDNLCSFVSWPVGNTVARFSCVPSAVGAPKQTVCAVNLTKSYQTGSNFQTSLTVLANSCATYQTNQTACTTVPGCFWCGSSICNAIIPTQSRVATNCSTSPACPAYSCNIGVCGASCNSTDFAGATCASVTGGLTNGSTLSCSPACGFDATACWENITAVSCDDNIDNDINNEIDYDGTPLLHGDADCKVAVSAIQLPALAFVSTPFVMNCSTPQNIAGGLTSLMAFVDNNGNSVNDPGDNLCAPSGWPTPFTKEQFTCVPTASGSRNVICAVNTSKSYQSGANQVQALTIQTNTCPDKPDSVTCEALATCDWCGGPQCNIIIPTQSKLITNCTAAGTCTGYTCNIGVCGASCNSTNMGGATCTSATGGLTNGTALACTPSCGIDASSCWENKTAISCDDNIDNDLNNEIDYDGTPVLHGDADCKVSVSAIQAPPVALASLPFAVNCSTPQNTAGGLTSLFSYVDNNGNSVQDAGDDQCTFVSWPTPNTKVTFSCLPSSVGLKNVICAVNTSKSYQSGANQVAIVDVQANSCPGKPDLASCIFVPTCEWCGGPQCSLVIPTQSKLITNCTVTGTCDAYSCHIGVCGATCEPPINFNGETCLSLTGGLTDGGALQCLPSCLINTSRCWENSTTAFPGTPCDDNVDNDLSGEVDYDGNLTNHGDRDCKVSVSAIQTPAQGFATVPFVMNCSTPQNAVAGGGISSLMAFIDNNGNGRNDSGDVMCAPLAWSAPFTTRQFSCTPTANGTLNAYCAIDTTISYQIGGNISSSINIQAGTCTDKTDNTTCEAIPACDWCGNLPQCGPPSTSKLINNCTAAGSCDAYACHLGVCGATCEPPGTFGGASCLSVTGSPGNTLLCTGTCSIDGSRCFENNAVWYPTGCTDGVDNDGSGEVDYDGNATAHGDVDCPVGIITAEAPPNVVLSSVFDANCTTPQRPATLTSMMAFIDNNGNNINDAGDDICTAFSWVIPNAKELFHCTPSVLGNHNVVCSVNASKSYQVNPNVVTPITVLTSTCPDKPDAVSCEAVAACDWCGGPVCGPGNTSRLITNCTGAGTCQPWVLHPGLCGAQCNSTDFGGASCASLTGGGGVLGCTALGAFNLSTCRETTASFCSDGLDNDADALTDYADVNPSIVPGQSCNVCDQSTCNGLTGVNLAPYGVCQPIKPYVDPSRNYTNATALRPGDASNLRVDCDGSTLPGSCWCAQCNTTGGYVWNGALGQCVAAETSVPNGCIDTNSSGGAFDNDANGVSNYNDAVCSRCTLADALLTLPTAESVTNTSLVVNAFIPLDMSFAPIPGNAARIRYAWGPGLGADHCYAVDCLPGFGWNASAGACTALACSPGGACAVNDDCGLYPVCQLLCVAGTCTAPPAVQLTTTPISPVNAYINETIQFAVSSTNAALTTSYRYDRNNDGLFENISVAPFTQKDTYALPITLVANASIAWSGGNPLQIGTSGINAPVDVYSFPVCNLSSVPSLGFEPLGPVTLILGGSIDPRLTGVFSIDRNENNVTYEWNATTPTSTTSIAALLAGNHTFYGRVTDSNGRQTNCSTQIVSVGNSPPAITFSPPSSLGPIVTQIWGGGIAFMNFTVNDSSWGMNITISYGDGLVVNDTTPTTSYSPPLPFATHTYTLPGVYVLNITVTDLAPIPLSSSVQFIINITGLDCVTGTQLGNATYNNLSTQCCNLGVVPNPTASVSCPAIKSGTWSCFAISACFPGNLTVCGGVPSTNPPVFVTRDNSSTTCEVSSATCTQYSWDDLNPATRCCGDALGEFPATWTFNGTDESGSSITPLTPASTANACCGAPNQCFTLAGIPGCYAGIENNVLLCNDGLDNDCDGLVDGADTGCAVGTVSGHVWLRDDAGNLKYATGAFVLVTSGINDTTDANGNYRIPTDNNPPQGAVAPLTAGNKIIYATKPGYRTESYAFTAVVGGNYTVDFTLQERKCNSDCTNDQGFCDRSCIGVGECQPTAPELETVYTCHPAGAPFGLKKGVEVVMQADDVNERLLVGVCCSVPGTWRAADIATVKSAQTQLNSIDTLVKFTRLITLNGKTYKLVISTW